MLFEGAHLSIHGSLGALSRIWQAKDKSLEADDDSCMYILIEMKAPLTALDKQYQVQSNALAMGVDTLLNALFGKSQQSDSSGLTMVGSRLLSGYNCLAIYVHSDEGEYPSENAG